MSNFFIKPRHKQYEQMTTESLCHQDSIKLSLGKFKWCRTVRQQVLTHLYLCTSMYSQTMSTDFEFCCCTQKVQVRKIAEIYILPTVSLFKCVLVRVLCAWKGYKLLNSHQMPKLISLSLHNSTGIFNVACCISLIAFRIFEQQQWKRCKLLACRLKRLIIC